VSEIEATLLPPNWITLPLSKVIQTQKGKKPNDLGEKSELRTIPYINIKAFEKGIVTEYAPEQEAVFCTEKDVLLVWDGARAGLSGRGISGYVGSTLAKVTSDLVEINFLSYYFESIYSILNTQTKGVGIPHINPIVLNSLPFNLAPKNEQARVVDKLEELFSELDAGVKELKVAKTKLSQYRQSLLKSAVEGSLTQQWRAENSSQVQETGEQLLARILKQRREHWQQQKLAEFAEKGKTPPKNWQDKYPEPMQPDTTDLPKLPEGWVWASLSQLVDLIQIGPFGSLLHKSDYISGGIPLINPTHIKNLKIEPDYNLTITEGKLSDLQKYVMSEGDIVIGRRGEMGRCALVSDKENGWLCGTGSLFIRVLQSLNPEFYTWVLSSKRTKDFLAEFSVGTTMQNLNQKILHSIPVPLLPENEQAAASDMLHSEYDRIDKQIEDIKVALKQSEAQRKNILKSAFSGQLVPQDPNDEPASVLLEKIKQEREALVKMPKARKPIKPKKKVDLMNTLLEVLTAENDWIDAQDAFQKCGIADGTSTDRIEEIYTELRRLEKAGEIQIQRQGDFDQLKFTKPDVKED